jgi:YesN/AraC family two-component response regulator
MDVVEHAHNFIEIQYVYAGEVKQIINGEEINLKKGSLTIFNKNTIHSIKKATPNDLMYFIFIDETILDTKFFSLLSLDNKIINYLFKSINPENTSNEYIYIKEINNEIKDLFELILLETRLKLFDYESLKYAYLMAMFIKLGRQEFIVGKNERIETVRRQKELLIRIDTYIRENYKDVTLKNMASELSFHPNYLCRSIKKMTGRTFLEMVMEVRLDIAENLLLMTEKTINDIAEEIGYMNSAYFYKLFKNQYGLTPSQYRKNHSMI